MGIEYRNGCQQSKRTRGRHSAQLSSFISQFAFLGIDERLKYTHAWEGGGGARMEDMERKSIELGMSLQAPHIGLLWLKHSPTPLSSLKLMEKWRWIYAGPCQSPTQVLRTPLTSPTRQYNYCSTHVTQGRYSGGSKDPGKLGSVDATFCPRARIEEQRRSEFIRRTRPNFGNLQLGVYPAAVDAYNRSRDTRSPMCGCSSWRCPEDRTQNENGDRVIIIYPARKCST